MSRNGWSTRRVDRWLVPRHRLRADCVYSAPAAEAHLLRAWKLTLPAFNGDATTSKRLGDFFKTAPSLARTGEVNIKQEVLQALGDDNGRDLRRVRDLVEEKCNYNEKALLATNITKDQLLTLFQIITYDNMQHQRLC